MLWRFLKGLSAGKSRSRPEPAPAAHRTGYVEPSFALINKMYREPPYDDPGRLEALVNALRALAAALQPNRPAGHAFLADELAAWFRNLGFLNDSRFVTACGLHAADPVIRARIWRVYTLCWAARSCAALSGDFVDLGCYDGKTVEIIARYAGFPASGKRYFVYDLFDDPPPEARKGAHGPGLYAEVKQRLQALGDFRVVQGRLPDAFVQTSPRRIAFAQLDLNVADAEIGCLERLYDRIVPGGMLVLDDYGFVRYRESHERERAFFAERGTEVLELPTGQGLLVKR